MEVAGKRPPSAVGPAQAWCKSDNEQARVDWPEGRNKATRRGQRGQSRPGLPLGERYAGDGVMVVFNDPVPVENPALQAVLMALEMREAIGSLTEAWRGWGHDIGFGIGIAHGFATLGTIGFEGRFDYAAIGTVSNVASRLCDEAKPGQILISPRVLTKVDNAVKVEPVGEFALKGIRRPLAAYNVLAAVLPGDQALPAGLLSLGML
jgi:class 3 adenylate cyclase